MKIYAYHPITGEFLGHDTARRDPEDSQNWIRPADTTDIAPPEPGEHQAAVFDRQAEDWSLVEDWRGHKYWTQDGQQHTISGLGVTPPEDALDEPPPPTAEDLAAKARKQRNALLRASDWTQLGDAQERLGPQLASEWAVYRQALADLPEQPGFPETINWPAEPVSA